MEKNPPGKPETKRSRKGRKFRNTPEIIKPSITNQHPSLLKSNQVTYSESQSHLMTVLIVKPKSVTSVQSDVKWYHCCALRSLLICRKEVPLLPSSCTAVAPPTPIGSEPMATLSKLQGGAIAHTGSGLRVAMPITDSSIPRTDDSRRGLGGGVILPQSLLVSQEDSCPVGL